MGWSILRMSSQDCGVRTRVCVCLHVCGSGANRNTPTIFHHPNLSRSPAHMHILAIIITIFILFSYVSSIALTDKTNPHAVPPSLSLPLSLVSSNNEVSVWSTTRLQNDELPSDGHTHASHTQRHTHTQKQIQACAMNLDLKWEHWRYNTVYNKESTDCIQIKSGFKSFLSSECFFSFFFCKLAPQCCKPQRNAWTEVRGRWDCTLVFLRLLSIIV